MLAATRPIVRRVLREAARRAAGRAHGGQPSRQLAYAASRAAREAAAKRGQFFTFADVDSKTLEEARAHEEETSVPARIGHTPVIECLEASHETYSVREEQTLDEAAAVMVAKRVASLLVRNAEGRVAGLLTERDYLKCHLGHVDGDTPVTAVMTPRREIVMAAPDATLKECLEIMLRRNFRHLPIYERDNVRGKRVIGVVSIRALVRQVFLEQDKEIHDLRDFITDSYSVDHSPPPAQ